MDSKINLKLLVLMLVTCLAFAYLGYFSTNVALLIVVFIMAFYSRQVPLLSGQPNQRFAEKPLVSHDGSENFSDKYVTPPNYWDVHFQNKVMFYNSPCFLNSNYKSNVVGTNCSISNLKNLPISFSWENFVLDDARMAFGAYRGNLNKVPYNSPVHIQSQGRDNMTQAYITVLNNKLGVTTNRNYDEQFIFVPEANNKNKYLRYGDRLYIKHVKTNQYIAIDNYSNNSLKLTTEMNNNSLWTLLNQLGYGRDVEVDWARESLAQMSSLYQSSKYPGSNCVDGDPNTFCHTDGDKDIKTPYFELHLPRLIDIQKITILNRQDCCKDRLGKFNIIIYIDEYDNETASINSQEVYKKENVANPDQNEFVLSNINVVGNRVRVQLIDTGSKRILNLATVSVFGNPVAIDVKSYLESSSMAAGPSANSGFILFKPIELTKDMVVPLQYPLQNNVGLHYLIQIFENYEERKIFALDDLELIVLGNGKIKVNYVVQDNQSKSFVSNMSLPKQKFNYINLFIYDGINAANGWTKIYSKKDDRYFIVNYNERSFFEVNPKNKNEYVVVGGGYDSQGSVNTSMDVLHSSFSTHENFADDTSSSPNLQLEQMDYLGTISESFENKPFIKLFINKKLDTFIQENAPITNTKSNKSNHSNLQLFTFSGLIGPFRISENYAPNEKIVKILDYKDSVNLGNFELEQKKKIPQTKLPTFNRFGYSFSFWLNLYNYASSDNPTNCILYKINNFVVKMDIEKNQLSFIFYYTDSTVKTTTNETATVPLQTIELNIPSSYLIIPYQSNNFAVVVDNVKLSAKIYQNNQLVINKKLKYPLIIDNYSAVQIGACDYQNKTQSIDENNKLKGHVTRLFMANYVLDKKDLSDLFDSKEVQIGPDVELVNRMFRETGCPADLIPSNWRKTKNDSRSQLIQMYLSASKRNPELLRKNFEDVKRIADDYIENAESNMFNQDKLRMVQLCYGKTTSQVIKRLYHVDKEIKQLKQQGEIVLNLFEGQMDGNSTTVIGPKIIKTSKIDNLIINFDAIVYQQPTHDSNVVTFKFIQGRKHAYIPQIYIEPTTGKWILDFFTTEGIESMTVTENIPLQTKNNICVVFQKGTEVNFYVNGKLVETQETLGQILISNIFEAIVGPFDSLSGFKGRISNLMVSCNDMYTIYENTKLLVPDILAIDKVRKITEPEIPPMNQIDESFSVHFWILYKSNPSNKDCSIIQGVVNNTLFKFTVNQSQSSLLISVGDTVNQIKLPDYFYNQWNYLTVAFNQGSEFTTFLVYLNDIFLTLLETKNQVFRETISPNLLLLGVCSNCFLKDLKISNYVLSKIQVMDFMNNKKRNCTIDSKNTSLFDFEKEVSKIKKELQSRKGANPAKANDKIEQKCLVIENDWNNFKNKNRKRIYQSN